MFQKKELLFHIWNKSLMPYKEEDWRDLIMGLKNARDLLQQAKDQPEKKSFYLSMAILSLWPFGEYAINVVLEMDGQTPDQNHRHADRAVDLARRGLLKRDYSSRLEQLEKYRLKAVHKGYSRGRSVHYSSQDVRNCLEDMIELQQEVEAQLRAQGKLQ